jgi:hypothetical protein
MSNCRKRGGRRSNRSNLIFFYEPIKSPGEKNMSFTYEFANEKGYDFFKAIDDVIDEGRFTITESGARLAELDLSHIMAITLYLPQKTVQKCCYTIGMIFHDLEKVTREIKPLNLPFQFQSYLASKSLAITTGSTECNIPLHDISAEEVNVEGLDSVFNKAKTDPFTSILKFKPNRLAIILNLASEYSEVLSLSAIDQRIILMANGNLGDMVHTFQLSDYLEHPQIGTTDKPRWFSLLYLKKILAFMKINEAQATLYLPKEMPMVAEIVIHDIHIRLFLADRLADVKDEDVPVNPP